MQFIELVSRASRDSVEITLSELALIYDSNDDGILGRILEANAQLERLSLEIRPPVNHGELDDVRIVQPKSLDELTDVVVRSLIEIRESGCLELKSTMSFDVQRAENDPGVAIGALRSDAVEHSVLKSIAGFMNSDGGQLLIGVRDSGDVFGIQKDFQVLNCTDRDPWELHLRGLIDGRFKNGKVINNYVVCRFCIIDGAEVCCVDVRKRRELTFLKDINGRYHLYHRQGNRTQEINIEDVEEYIAARRA